MEKELTPYLNDAQRLCNSSKDFQNRVNYYNARKEYSVDDKMILYEAFYGRGITCNPGALFLYLLKDSRFADFTHVIVLEESDLREKIMAQFEGNDKVKFVVPFTPEYLVYLSKAKYLINNVTWQNYYVKKPEQIVINTWHGIPLKSLGYDVPNGNMDVANIIRNLLFTDYLISPVPFTTDNFRYAFKLEGIFPGKVIETGYPRIDDTFHASRDSVAEELKNVGVNYDKSKKLILYAPTWRGEKYGKPDIEIDKYNQFIDTIYKYVDKNEYQVLFKPHQIVYKSLAENGLLQDNYIPATVNTNALLGVTDILISDYSSIFFDFLVTDRPIIFYVPDLEEYQQARGLYLPVEDLPGPLTDSLEQVALWCGDIENYSSFFDTSKYTAAKEKFTKNDDGNVCERIVNAVFFGDQTYTISLNNEKKKLLFHIDSLMTNGITFSLMNLLNNIDESKYDISLYGIVAKTGLDVVEKIPSKVRAIIRKGAANSNIEDYARKQYCIDNAIIKNDGNPIYPTEFYEQEFKRCFGDAKFDYIINFSGYNGFWVNVYNANDTAKHLIWMHNDLVAEYNKIVNGKQIHKTNLSHIFKIYDYVDKIIGCSRSTMIENRDNLSNESTFEKFTYSKNLINIDRIESLMDSCDIKTLDGGKYLTRLDETGNGVFRIKFVPLPNSQNINFVTMGRMSPEKNHANLIKAFARFHKEHENSCLYIIGEGPLLNSTRTLITKLKLTGKVILTGNMENPFSLMKMCDCFLLPSLHEGLPMVLLEARTLGLPIIVSDFSTVSDSLYDNGQLLIGTEEEDIYNGLIGFLEGKVPKDYDFDPHKYNQEAMAEFEACLN